MSDSIWLNVFVYHEKSSCATWVSNKLDNFSLSQAHKNIAIQCFMSCIALYNQCLLCLPSQPFTTMIVQIPLGSL